MYTRKHYGSRYAEDKKYFDNTLATLLHTKQLIGTRVSNKS